MWGAILFTLMTFTVLFMMIGFYAYDINKMNRPKMWWYLVPHITVTTLVAVITLTIVWSTI
jgi:hypothetical protein